VRAAEKGRRDAIRKAKASGMSAVELAELLSISRQQVYAIAGDAKIREF
jgi:DNA invertase Pin-like site-specific DNA recombinase